MNRAGQPSPTRDATHAEVASALWHERELLESLLFALTCQQFVLASGNVRWLPAADERVRTAVDVLTDCELRRAIGTTELATLLGLPGDATLEQISAAADAPWDVVLGEHRAALRTLAGEIEAVTRDNRRMLQAGADLGRLGQGAPGDRLLTSSYPGFDDRRGTVHAVLFDRQA